MAAGGIRRAGPWLTGDFRMAVRAQMDGGAAMGIGVMEIAVSGIAASEGIEPTADGPSRISGTAEGIWGTADSTNMARDRHGSLRSGARKAIEGMKDSAGTTDGQRSKLITGDRSSIRGDMAGRTAVTGRASMTAAPPRMAGLMAVVLMAGGGRLAGTRG